MAQETTVMRDQFMMPLGSGNRVLEEVGGILNGGVKGCSNVRVECTKFGLIIIGLLCHCQHDLVGGVE